ncbi:MAG: hypothetical protein AABW88_03240 [Nanoarchaeota archaeon]
MLSPEIVRQIEEFVYASPRSVQEIAGKIGKNWRTADRYITEIEKEFGTIATKVFRGGTKGALKVVYWASVEKASKSVFQEQLEKTIINGRKKEDFSAFDIFQHVPSKNKTVWMKIGNDEVSLGRLKEFIEILEKAEKQIIFFSGNLSFINFRDKKYDVFKTLEELVRKNISIKAICRVDVAGFENVKRLLSLNYKYGKELIEIRHREQPLRATIIDNKISNLKEIKEPTGRNEELSKKSFIFYTIKDKEWIEWMNRVFWKMFSSSIDSNKRIEQLSSICT